MRIKRASSDSRVLIVVPDGEIEDFGTALTLGVANARTTHVSVAEGEVEVRLHGFAPLRLTGGQSWTAHHPEESSTPRTSEAPLLAEHPLPIPSVKIRRPLSPAEHSSRSRASLTRASASAAAAMPVPDDIAAARAEDRAYLKVVELARAGEQRAARAAALDYLARFPHGLRRLELLNLVDPDASDW
jgi:hypothetical protein